MIAQATPEVPRDPAQLAREHAQSFMGSVVDAKSYPEQWCAYENMGAQAARDGVLAAGLVDYAADEKGTDSLLWRSFALEAGLQGIRRAVLYGGRELSAAEQGIYEKAKQIIPEFFEEGFLTQFVGDEGMPDNLSYHWFFRQLAKCEGINPRMIAVDAYAMGYDPTSVSDNIPVATGLLLNRMMRAETYHDVAALPESLANDMLRVALNFQGPEYGAAIADNPSRLGEFARLARFAERAGYEHDAPTEYLYNAGEQGLEYARAMNRLYDSLATTLPDMFPDESVEGVVQGARFLAAGSLFAAAKHLRQGEFTNELIPLLGGKEEPAIFKGKEPLVYLQWFDSVLRRGHAIKTDPRTRVDHPINEPDFDIYDFKHPTDPLRVMEYIRPEGGYTCNYRYEYGGRSIGVQASIGLTFDEEPASDPARPYHKKSLSSKSVNIRLDREGRAPGKAMPLAAQNPTAEIGTISLDVGSIMGSGYGGRLARWIAVGNIERAKAIGANQSDLNHATSQLDQNLGTANGFRRMALSEKARLGLRRQQGYGRSSVLVGAVEVATS